MPVYVDASEVRSNSTMPDIPDAIIVNGLEEITGADLMISTMQVPPNNEALINIHIQNNAILVQRKHGHDLSSSVGERLNTSLSKMKALNAKYPQCVLLFIGFLTADDQGIATINKQTTGMPFFSVQSAISKWHDRGGVYENLPKASLLAEWCRMKLRNLDEYAAHPEKQQLASAPRVEIEDELQVVYTINDARVMLSCIPGIGQKMVNTLWNEFGNASEILCYLTMLDKDKKIKGLGPKTIEKAREYLGILDVFELQLVPTQEIMETGNG